MKKKMMALILSAMLTAGLLAGCGGDSSSGAAASETAAVESAAEDAADTAADAAEDAADAAEDAAESTAAEGTEDAADETAAADESQAASEETAVESAVEEPGAMPSDPAFYVGSWELLSYILDDIEVNPVVMGMTMTLEFAEDGTGTGSIVYEGEDPSDSALTWAVTEIGLDVTDEDGMTMVLYYMPEEDHLYLDMDEQGLPGYYMYGRSDSEEAARVREEGANMTDEEKQQVMDEVSAAIAASQGDYIKNDPRKDPDAKTYSIEQGVEMIGSDTLSVKTTGELVFSQEYGALISFDVVNDNDYAVYLAVADDLNLVNGYQADCTAADYSNAIIAAGASKTVLYRFAAEDLKMAEITEIGTVSLMLQAHNSDDLSQEAVAGSRQDFTTGVEGDGRDFSDCEVIYEDEMVRVRALGITEDSPYEGYRYLNFLLVEDLADEPITFSLSGEKINGLDILVIASAYVYPGSSSIVRPFVEEERLTEAEITEIESVTGKFTIMGKETSTYDFTDEVTIQ